MKNYTITAKFTVEATSRQEAYHVARNQLRTLDEHALIVGIKE